MIKINFVCYGNICRSPMAEFVMKNLVTQAGLSKKFLIESSGCHPAVGTPIHVNSCRELKKITSPLRIGLQSDLQRRRTKILTTLFVWIVPMFMTLK